MNITCNNVLFEMEGRGGKWNGKGKWSVILIKSRTTEFFSFFLFSAENRAPKYTFRRISRNDLTFCVISVVINCDGNIWLGAAGYI